MCLFYFFIARGAACPNLNRLQSYCGFESAGMDRRFFAIEDIRTSLEATAVLRSIISHARRTLERYRDCDQSDLQAILDGMNATQADIANRFAYCDFLGGLVHIQVSYVAGEAAWIMLPTSGDNEAARPVDRIALQINGLVCTRAPADAFVAWQSSPGRHSMLMNAEGDAVTGRRVCAKCDEVQHLRDCGQCRLVRYCGRECQRSHWRVGHKPLCTWAKACIDGQFGTTVVLRHTMSAVE